MLLTHNYQHFSFDLWLTLIRSNPEFKQHRTAFFHQQFNYHHLSVEDVSRVFRQVDIMCNLINEKTGKNIDADEMYLMVLSMINDGDKRVWQIDMDKLYADMEAMVFKYLPVVYCDRTLAVLSYIKENTSATIGILSNTGLIKGVTLRRVLNQIGVDKFIDFQLYSDETGMSKPNPEFFKLMLKQLGERHIEIDFSRVIHIGDNPNADVAGANAVGLQSCLINSNNVGLPDIINYAQHVFTT